jgi:hypothetical protein
MLRSGVGGEEFGELKEGIEVVTHVGVLAGNCLWLSANVRLTRASSPHLCCVQETVLSAKEMYVPFVARLFYGPFATLEHESRGRGHGPTPPGRKSKLQCLACGSGSGHTSY